MVRKVKRGDAILIKSKKQYGLFINKTKTGYKVAYGFPIKEKVFKKDEIKISPFLRGVEL